MNFLTAGWSVTESTFEDNSNSVFGTAICWLRITFLRAADTFFRRWPLVTAVTSPFSVTELFQISSNGLSGAMTQSTFPAAFPSLRLGR